VAGAEEVSYVRPHELEVVAQPGPDTWPVTFSQALTVGPNTRIEFKREDADGYIDVELARESYARLREQVQLVPGARAHLRPRRIRRFELGRSITSDTNPVG
jgi:sulfate transport system ATP-binding protein